MGLFGNRQTVREERTAAQSLARMVTHFGTEALIEKITRLCIVNEYGRVMDMQGLEFTDIQLQDNGRTLKVFVKARTED